jgi:acetyltransferase-like isoleucine patch superfamily enzyme
MIEKIKHAIGFLLWKSFWRILTNPTPGFHVLCRVDYPENIEGLPACSSFGCFFQAVGKIKMGSNCWFAQNSCIITSNHDFDNIAINAPPKPITIGNDCWIGANAVILPGVVLGNHTIVGAGSIVTKSFPEGHCVIAGNPAKTIRRL